MHTIPSMCFMIPVPCTQGKVLLLYIFITTVREHIQLSFKIFHCYVMLGVPVGSLHCKLSWWHICVWYIYSNNEFRHSGVKSRIIKKDKYRSCLVLGDAARLVNIAVRETNSALRLVAHILCRAQEPENTINTSCIEFILRMINTINTLHWIYLENEERILRKFKT